MSDSAKRGRTVELFVFDCFIALAKIKKVASKFDSAQDLMHSFTDWDCVIREFEILGEASKHLLNHNLLESRYRKIVDFRNQITHEYFGIDEDIVWAIINNELHAFEETIFNIIDNIDKELRQELIDSFIEDNSYLDFIVKELESLGSRKREKGED